MRDIQVQFIALGGVTVVVHVMGTVLPALQLERSQEEGPVDCDGKLMSPSFQI